MKGIYLEKLKEEYREQFILDNQYAFKYGAITELKENELDIDGEIISRETINSSIDDVDCDTYRIMDNDKCVGGIIVKINKETNRNALEILYINPNCHNKGYGQRAWKLIENIYPETNVWETCTPYFERRNIHFYVNRLKFHIVEYYNSKNPDPNMPDDYKESNEFDGMFKFEKVMKEVK